MAKRRVSTTWFDPEWRRVLELLAHSADGCTEALLFAHGFTDEVVAGLVDTGLVAATTKHRLLGQRTVDVTWFNITDRGRATLER